MSPLQFIRNDFRALTRCKWSGHVISVAEMSRIKHEDKEENESECVYCGWPVMVRKDPANLGYWLISEE